MLPLSQLAKCSPCLVAEQWVFDLAVPASASGEPVGEAFRGCWLPVEHTHPHTCERCCQPMARDGLGNMFNVCLQVGWKKSSFCGVVAKWAVSLSPMEMPFFWFFSSSTCLLFTNLHVVFSSVLWNIWKWIESWNFFSLFIFLLVTAQIH